MKQVAMLFSIFLAVTIQGRAGTWTQLTHSAPCYTGTMMLLPDGSVMVQSACDDQSWFRLSPDSHGSYANGTWGTIATMSTPRLYFASVVLPSNKVWVLGGEYSGSNLTANWTNTGEIWDMATNTWSPITSYPSSNFGDDPSMLLPGGKILAGDLSTPFPNIFNIASNTWSPAGRKVYYDPSDEESWAKLSNGSVFTYDIFQTIATGKGYAEVYNPTTNSWSSISPADGTANGTLPVLSSSALGYELGPALRLQDGRLFQIGANQHTALYTEATNTWAAGPDIPYNFGADDAPAAEEASGLILFAADAGPVSGTFSPPTKIFEFDPNANSITDVTPPDSNLSADPAFISRMLALPNGQILFSDITPQLWVYTPSAGPLASARPVINSVAVISGRSYTLTGKQLNGQSAGSSYGDDVQSDENFPLVRLTSATGNVYYATSSNWSGVGVGGAAPETVNFTVGASVPAGNYSLVVVGSGIPSFPQFVTIH